MKNNQPVLAIYDLRGIQNFIFRTNKVKEIIGASRIVATLLEDAFEAFVKPREETGEKHNRQWYTIDKESNEKKPQKFEFENSADSPVSEILYCGGGNLLVAWRTEALALKAGRFMSRYVLDRAYSLSLSWAMTYKTENYNNDYVALCEKLDRVKSLGYRATPLTGVPFSVQETGTGLPVVVRDKDGGRISKETALKRETEQSDKDQLEGEFKFCQKINEMTEGMRKNYVAVVHIDGNSMGSSIRKRLESCGDDYQKAVSEMRKLSLDISTTFENALHTAISNQGEGKDKSKLMLRPIICAGDDITFIARADIALTMVKDFITEIKKNGFSACAGITYVRAHFPFYRAYEYAEQLCASAKKKAREIAKDEPMGNFVDFHIIGSGVIGEISAIRDREYVNAQGYSLLQRPLTLDNEEKTDSVSAFEKNIEDWQGKMVDGKKTETVSRKWLKALRNAYQISEAEVLSIGKQMAVFEARKVIKNEAFDQENRALYFDALEMMDMVLGAEE